MQRIMLAIALLFSILCIIPPPVTFACRGCASGGGGAGSSSQPTIFSPSAHIQSGAGVYSTTLDYMFQFNLGQNVSLIEIAPCGSTSWTPLLDDTQTPLHTRSGRIAHFRQDIFDGIYTFDIRINGAVVWHNIEVRNERLIVLGYNNGPIIVAVIDHYRK